MPFFEKLPVTIEARQYDGTYSSYTNISDWSEGAVFIDSSELTIKVKTLEGTSYTVPKGYWIIKGVNGEFYPCENSIFKKTYKEVASNKFSTTKNTTNMVVSEE